MSKAASREIRLVSRPAAIPTAANLTLARVELAPLQDQQALVGYLHMSGGHTMNAVIIYDDFACAAKAKVMLERAAHRADVASLWTIRPWRLDMLMPSLSADAALTDAADAHLMVLVLRHSLSLPAWVLDWLDRWAKCRQVQDAALAVRDGGNGDTLSASAAPELSWLTGRHGLTFIFRDAGPDEDESATCAANPHEREVFATRCSCHLGARAASPILGGAMNE